MEDERNELPENEKFGSWIKPFFFYGNYFLIMLLWTACWDSFPKIAFWAFLVVSSYHFGEGDLDYIQGLSQRFRYLLYLSRGTLVVGLTLTSRPHITLPIIQKLITMPKKEFHSQCIHLAPLIVLQHFLLLGYLFFYNNNAVIDENPKRPPFPPNPVGLNSNICKYELFRAFLFVMLFKHSNPLVAFSIFFGVWHSSTTINGAIKYLKRCKYPFFDSAEHINTVDVIRFYILAFPYTLISLSGMVGMYSAKSVVGWNEIDPAMAWAVFICAISILTGSHMWILGALHNVSVSLDPCNIGAFFGFRQAKKRYQM
jgi:Brp/Blh family beta-carotene 15,15'-monooxygenase